MDKKIVYYSDETKDDFAGTNIAKKKVDANFKYIRKNPFWLLLSFVLYYLIAIPLVWVFERIILRVKFVNKSALKPYRKRCCYFYGNHTGYIDAYTPNLLSIPRRNRIIVGPDTTSINFLKNITQMLGAIPLPTEMSGMRKFSEAVDHYHKKCNITIYPEAHIWPYYTGVRPFSDASFAYAVKHNAPVFAFFTAYTRPKGFLSCFRKANITVYVSEAIFPDEGLVGREARMNLRDKVYNFMLSKSELSDYQVIKYIRKDDGMAA